MTLGRLSDGERRYLRQLIDTTHRIKGSQFPNPGVGAMVIKDGVCIAQGVHELAGESHAEVIALDRAGKDANGATMLITLEPCCHHGKTPPCVDRIIQSNIRRVAWAIDDPSPPMMGAARAILEANGIEVIANAMVEEGRELINEFYAFHAYKRPYVYVKAAMSLDGYIAPDRSKLNYISSAQSLHLVQQLRTYVQAICVGGNTINVDQPRLSVRVPRRLDTQPMIVIFDPSQQVDMSWVNRMADNGRQILLCQRHNNAGLHEVPHTAPLQWMRLTDDKVNNWRQLMICLYNKGIQGVLIEGGQAMFQSILQSSYFDELWITKVPQLLSGGCGVPFLMHGSVIRFNVSFTSVEPYGEDVVIKYKNNHAFAI